MSVEADLQGYTPPISLWKLVEQHVDDHETDEIKSVLGADLVDETLELHTELNAFLEIWRDCRKNTDECIQVKKSLRLPEPPGVRDRLIQEIKFFIENLKEKAQGEGREFVLDTCKNNIIDYATNESRPPSHDLSFRPASAIGQDGRETPFLSRGSPFSDRVSSSTYSTLSEDVEAMADKLNILKVDEVVQHLRSHLLEEKELLIQDVKFLQECIEEENQISVSSNAVDPTISELREERLKLEKEMLSDIFVNQRSLQKGVACLKPASAKKRISVIPMNKPLKAVHLSAPDGIVLSGNVPESVVAKTQQTLHEQLSDDSAHYSQTLPSSHMSRPSSARRFRSMIMDARSVNS